MKKYIVTAFVLFSCLAYSQNQVSILGKSQIGVLTVSNITNSPLDSASYSGSDEILYEIFVKTGSADSAGTVLVNYTNLITNKQIAKYINGGLKDTVSVSGLRLCFNDTLSTNDRARIVFRYNLPVAVDSTGSLFSAMWDYAKTDTVTTISATPDTVLLTGDYPRGITVIANKDLQFRTNRITGWVFASFGTIIGLPIRHTSSDTLFIKTAAIPDATILRGR
jgi:hypothetical protein